MADQARRREARSMSDAYGFAAKTAIRLDAADTAYELARIAARWAGRFLTLACLVLLAGCNPESPSDRLEERCGPVQPNCWTVCQPQDAGSDGDIVARRVC